MDSDAPLNSFNVNTCVGKLCCESAGDPTDPLVIMVNGSHEHGGAHEWRTHLSLLCEHDIYAVSFSYPGAL
jgi:hypothetical protein